MNLATSKPAAPVVAPALKLLSSRGKRQHPLWITLFATEGVGKSTFAHNAPAPIFIDVEQGTLELDTDRFVFDGAEDRSAPKSWAEVLGAMRALENGGHAFKTLVVDTLDGIEPLIATHVCTRDGKANLEAYGYGKGVTAALEEWRVFVAQVERLKRRGMWVITLAHSHIKSFKDPESDGWDRYQMKMNEKAASLIRERSDIVLFANQEALAHESKGRVRGVSSGARFMHTERTAAFDAKNRHGLPSVLPLSWEDFEAALKAGIPATAEQIQKEIDALMAKVPADLAVKVQESISKAAGDARKLAQVADRLRAKMDTNEITNTNTENQS